MTRLVAVLMTGVIAGCMHGGTSRRPLASLELTGYQRGLTDSVRLTFSEAGRGGSGWRCSASQILTAFHLLPTSGKLQTDVWIAGPLLRGQPKKRFRVRRIYSDPLSDLALLDVEKLPEAKIGFTLARREPAASTPVYVMGYPINEFQQDESPSLHFGIVSRGRRRLRHAEAERDIERLELAVPAWPATSGAMVLNAGGEVVGIMTEVLRDQGGWAGASYATHIGDIRAFLMRYVPKSRCLERAR